VNIEDKLKDVIYPGFEKDIISFGFLKDIKENNNKYEITLEIPSAAVETKQKLENDIKSKLDGIDYILEIKQPEPKKPSKPVSKNIAPNIKHFVMVSSGKGGVGKTTTSVNIAVAMAMEGKKVGLLDADIYGPNVPRMMGFINQKLVMTKDKVEPYNVFGVKAMSMGSLIDKDQSLVWRGAMIMKAITQLLRDINWGDLDILVIDMPPGTGDAQLTLAQSVPVSLGLVVTTPQMVSLDDSKRSLDMFKKLNIPIAGMVENMSGFICPNCDEETDIFDKETTKLVASEFDCKVLASIPLDMGIRRNGDIGKPITYFNPEHKASKEYIKIASEIINQLENSNTSNAGIQPTSDGKPACSTTPPPKPKQETAGCGTGCGCA